MKKKPLVTLMDHLEAWYLSSVREVGENSPTSIVESFKQKSEQNPDLKTQARKMLDAMAGINEERCFITRTYKSFLIKALN